MERWEQFMSYIIDGYILLIAYSGCTSLMASKYRKNAGICSWCSFRREITPECYRGIYNA